ncbi:TVP38/TMEM64 family protein [Alkalihalobacillus sp. 1P02AB]|uniref:TVP38/TMEM64 family protein n=1 Tax=Alkalihalobacillus sp. 1P02AB TaxID=3132260 RepID=UPI0039A71020
MNEKIEAARQFIEASGWLAPFFFIVLHIIRPFLFIPVLLTCLVGGYIFGTLYGALYSIIGLTLTSLFFYLLIHYFPNFGQRLSQLKGKIMKSGNKLTDLQLMVIRLIPFIHFHFVSLYVFETTNHFRDYAMRSILFVLPPAIIYTAFGDMIHQLPLTGTITLTLILLLCLLIFRKKEETIKWADFFRM